MSLFSFLCPSVLPAPTAVVTNETLLEQAVANSVIANSWPSNHQETGCCRCDMCEELAYLASVYADNMLRPTVQCARPIYKADSSGNEEIVVVGYEIVTVLLSEVQDFYNSYPVIAADSEIGRTVIAVPHIHNTMCGYCDCKDVIANPSNCYSAIVS